MTTIVNELLSSIRVDESLTDRVDRDFRADDGNQPGHRRGRTRTAWAKIAWQDLMARRIQLNGDTALPSAWELTRPIQAVSIALEAAGSTPSAVNGYGSRITPGYSVSSSSTPGIVRVSFKIPAAWEAVGSEQRVEPKALHGRMTRALKSYRSKLNQRGWDVTGCRMEYPQAYLLVEPRTA